MNSAPIWLHTWLQLLKIAHIQDERGGGGGSGKTCMCGFVILSSFYSQSEAFMVGNQSRGVIEQSDAAETGADKRMHRGYQLVFFFFFCAWLSAWCQGLDVPTYSTKFGQNWDYSGRRNAWMTSACPFSLPRSPFLSLPLSPLIFFYIVSSLLSPLSSCSSPRQSLIFFFGTKSLWEHDFLGGPKLCSMNVRKQRTRPWSSKFCVGNIRIMLSLKAIPAMLAHWSVIITHQHVHPTTHCWGQLTN